MKVKFWGVRGSIPSPGPKTMRVGGNTSCFEILPSESESQIIVDAGTGIRELGLNMMGRGNVGRVKANLFLTHTHWDHIHGFPFFVPAFIPGNRITIYGPVNSINASLKDVVSGQMDYSYFPVPLQHLGSKIDFKELKEGPAFDVDGVMVRTQYLNHPILVLGYRFEYKGKVVVTEFDTEPYSNIFKKETKKDEMDDFLFGDGDDADDAAGEGEKEDPYHEASKVADEMNRRVVTFAKDADLLVFDAQYTADEYKTKIGWGHGSYEDAIRVATEANVKRLAFFHHDPTRNDDAIDEIEKNINNTLKKMGRTDVHIFAAREGMEIDL